MRDVQGKLIMESVFETKATTILEFVQGLRGTLALTFEEGFICPIRMLLPLTLRVTAVSTSPVTSAVSLSLLASTWRASSHLQRFLTFSDLPHPAVHVEFDARDIRGVGTRQKENRIRHLFRRPRALHWYV